MPPVELGSGTGELETETTPGFGRDGTSELRTGTYEIWEEVEEGEAKAVVADAGSVGLLLAGAESGMVFGNELPSGQNVIRRPTYICVGTSSANGVQRVYWRWAYIFDLAGHLNLIVSREMERSSAVRRCTCARLFSFRGIVRDKGQSYKSRPGRHSH
jgi:hypothetical protein